jgi:hypothetical protein
MDRTGRNVDQSTDTLRGAKVVERQQSNTTSTTSSTSSITSSTNGEKRSQNCNDAAPSSRHLKQVVSKPTKMKAIKHKTMGEPRRYGMTNRVLTNSGKIVVIDSQGDEDKKGSKQIVVNVIGIVM